MINLKNTVPTDCAVIIFLDIDGVLRQNSAYDGQLDAMLVQRFNKLADKLDAKIVISSTWRNLWSVKQFNAHLNNRVIGMTEDKYDDAEDAGRYGEIIQWLKKHPEFNPVRWIALDDTRRHFPNNCKTLYSPDSDTGLDDELVQQIINDFGLDTLANEARINPGNGIMIEIELPESTLIQLKFLCQIDNTTPDMMIEMLIEREMKRIKVDI